MEFGRPRNPRAIHLVGDVDGTPVGSVILTPQGRDTVKLSKLFVHSSFRGAGLGRSLLHRAVAEAKARGYQEVFLTTRALYREAVNLYESEGWIRGPDQATPGPDRLYYLTLTHPTQRVLAAKDCRAADIPNVPLRMEADPSPGQS
jgi:predicted N-acetyltransferase YhbS